MPCPGSARSVTMMLGMPVSAGFVDLASGRLSARLQDEAVVEALASGILPPMLSFWPSCASVTSPKSPECTPWIGGDAAAAIV